MTSSDSTGVPAPLDAAQESDRTYQIGTVSTLTGIDPHTIRAWERRYGAIKPARSATGRRVYDDEAVERLQLLKALNDFNEAIGTIAHLSDPELRERIEKIAAHESVSPDREKGELIEAGRPRLAVMATTLAAQLKENAGAVGRFEIAVSESGQKAFLEAVRRSPCDVILLELENLGANPVGFVRTCRALPGTPIVFVLYQFAQRVALAQLVRMGARLVRTPMRLAQLERAIHDQIMIERARRKSPFVRREPATTEVAPAAAGSKSVGESTARRFSDEQLARLLEISTAIDCECPNHLSSLVSGLVAFEAYSRNCSSRDEADSAVHQRLASGTAEARAQLETLLAQVCEHEGIRI